MATAGVTRVASTFAVFLIGFLALLAATGVSPSYLRDHLLRALRAQGHRAGLMLVSRLGTNAAWTGLPADGEDWLRQALD